MKKLFSLLFCFFCFTCNTWAHPIDMDALAQIESSGNPQAWNKSSDARGMYQITPIVLRQFMDDPHAKVIMTNESYLPISKLNKDSLFMPEINRHVADYYLDWLDARIESTDEICIAWNWGIGKLRKWQRNGSKFKKLPKETQNFIKKYHELTEGK